VTSRRVLRQASGDLDVYLVEPVIRGDAERGLHSERGVEARILFARRDRVDHAQRASKAKSNGRRAASVVDALLESASCFFNASRVDVLAHVPRCIHLGVVFQYLFMHDDATRR